ncbi:hypothetical protein, partial [Streptomyces sp. SID6137]|nr:hypothetical protein [Streptomyces sp. SID6137]
TGAAGAGAAGAGAAGAGASMAGASVVLKVVAVIVAVVVGRVVISQAVHSFAESRSGSSSSSSSSDTGLAGRWTGSDGATYEFDASGGGYVSRGRDACGQDASTEFTGGGDTYSAERPIYDTTSGSCTDLLGEATTTITLSGDSAKVTTTMTKSYQQGVQCFSCGTLYLTRQQ